MDILLTVIKIFFYIYAWMYFSIFIHEMGHFVVAKISGLQPNLVKIGSGSKSWQFNLFDARFEFMAMPSGGVTQITNLFVNQLKLKLIFFYLAGIFAQLILIFAIIYLYSIFLDHPILFILLCIEGWLILASLIPSDVVLYNVILSNDGKSIFEVLRTNYQQMLHSIVDLSKYEVRDENLERGLFKSDIVALRKFSQALVALTQSNFDTAIKLFTDLLNEPKLLKSERVLILDDLVSIVINHNQKQYLPLADSWSMEALEIATECKTIQGTRGAILVELERFSEGKEMLLPLAEVDNEPIDIFFSSCYLAKADFYLGNEEKVRDWLLRAKKTGLLEKKLLEIQQELNFFI